MRTLAVLLIGIGLGFVLATAALPILASEWTVDDDDRARYGYGQPNFFITGPDSTGHYRSPAELPQLFEPSRRHPC